MKSISIAVFALLYSSVFGLENGIAQTPQMGWNTWNKFDCGINETLIKQSADKIIELGLDKLGYKYVNIDDCWNAVERDSEGRMQADPKTFPGGMKAVGDYIHSKGLKYGIYSSAGNFTCQGRAGSLNHEDIDAQTWADWGVDYLKYDNCFNENVPATVRYPAMRDALLKTGRNIFYSICNWGNEETFKWGPDTGNSWRTTMDIKDIWPSIQYNYRQNDVHYDIAHPGAWNDPDMLEIGNGGLNQNQERTHFALWAVAKSPLILGCDLDNIPKDSFEIITNTELIAINQDPLGKQAHCRVHCSSTDILVNRAQVYAGPLENGDIAVVVVNWGFLSLGAFTLNFSDIDLSATTSATIRDLWEHKDIGDFTGTYSIDKFEPYQSYAFRITPKKAQEFLN
eukprot:403356745